MYENEGRSKSKINYSDFNSKLLISTIVKSNQKNEKKNSWLGQLHNLQE